MRKPLLLGLGAAASGTSLGLGVSKALAYLLIASTAAPPAYVGPGDITTFTSWYGLRAYSAAVAAAGTQKLVNITRASDSHACDVLVATSGGMGLTTSCGTGGDNGQSASSFCTSTTCSVAIVYDQVGANNLTSNGGNTFPTLSFNCINTTLPCIRADGGIGQEIRTSGNVTPANRNMSISLVGQVNTNSPIPFQENGIDNYLTISASGTWTYNGGNAGTVVASLVDNSFHASNIAIDLTPNTSTYNGDGTETTSTNVNNDTAAGPIIIARSTVGGILLEPEVGFIDGTTWTLSIRSKLCDNQGSYYATSKGTHCNSSGT